QGWQTLVDVRVECSTLADGPFGIESDADIRAVEPLLLTEMARRDDCAAFVIACYSDPALDVCRRTVGKPVFGMQQSAVATAIAQGGKFGVLALSQRSIDRHLVYLQQLGVRQLLAGERPLNVSVDAAANGVDTLERIIENGRQLIEIDGATVLILGCAGMAAHRLAAEQALGVAVVDPVQAATAFAIAALVNQ
ncbi:MAG: aspartate/glutamate racemase family protein, partial [Woeseia sp.]